MECLSVIKYRHYKVFKSFFGPSCILQIHMHTYKALHITYIRIFSVLLKGGIVCI